MNNDNNKMRKNERLGETNLNNYGRIIEYRSAIDVVIEFQDEHKCKKKCEYNKFKKGQVKNPYDKSVYGIGYIGVGEYNWKNGSMIYEHYINMK